MDQVTLRANLRTEFGNGPARRLRNEGLIPAVVYGREMATTSVVVDERDLTKGLHTEAGLNALFNLEVGSDTVLAVAREIQRHPVRGTIQHLDFIKVALDVAIEATVSIDFEGVPVGVRDDGGIVETIHSEVEILALPLSVPPHISLDISEMRIGDVLRVGDLPLMEGVTFLDDDDEPLVTVSVPAAEIEPEVELAEGEEPGELDEDGEEVDADDVDDEG